MSDSAPPPGSSSTPSSDPSSSSDGSPPVPSPPSSDNGQGAPPPDESSSSSSPPSPPSDNPPSPPDSSSSPPPPSDSSQDGAPPPSNSNDPPPPPPGSDNQPPPNSGNPEAPPPPSGSSSSPPGPPRSPPSHGNHPPPPPDGGSSSSPPSNSPSPPDNSNFPPPAIFPSPKNPSSPPKSSPEVPSPPSGTEPSPPDTPPGSDNPVPDPSSPPRVVPSPPSRHTPSPPFGSGTLTPVPPQSSHSSTHNGSGSSSSSKNSSSSSSGGGTAAGITIGVLVLAMAALCFVVVRKRRRRRADLLMNHYQPPSSFSVKSGGYYNSGPMRSGGSAHSYSYAAPHSGMSHGGYGSQRGGYGTPSGMGMESGALGSAKSWFSYEELMEITNGFSHENMIGEGGFGCVYKGYLSGGKEVAVKQLKIGSGQGEREFRAEVEIISRVHHRHLVSLVGYCIAEHHRLLVYEFVPNGTLEHHLHGKGSMEWSKRVKIAIGSAKGLAYLHEDCHPRIIHRDIKSANILLDNSFEAQVADFGLAKLSNDTHTHVSTRVMGTFGYMAPEYASSGKLTDRSDVFSFGVVLLELVTGRKPVDPSQPLGEESLVEWARPLLIHAIETGEVQELVDPRLENNFDRNEMIRMIETAAACVRHSAPKRPRMQQVVRALDSEGEMADLTNGVKYGQSTVFQSSQYPSTDIQKFRRMAFGSNEQFSSQEYQPSAYSGEYGPHSREHWPQSSGEYPSNSDSETRAIYRRPS